MNKKPLLALFGTILLLLGGYVFLRHSSNPPGSLPNTGNSAGLSSRQQSLLQQPALPPTAPMPPHKAKTPAATSKSTACATA